MIAQRKKRFPTKNERAVAEALGGWLDKMEAKIVHEESLSRGRFLRTWKTSAGLILVCVTDNRVTGVAVQINHEDPLALARELDRWAMGDVQTRGCL